MATDTYINQVAKSDYSALRISFTDKDYVTILDDLINSIPGISQKWESTDVNDPGNILVKLMAMMGEMLFYTQDMQSLEVYPNSVTLRKNAATIYKLIGYKMNWYRSATLQADVVNTYTSTATIPRFCTFTTQDGSITYSTFDTVDLASNTTNNGTMETIELVQGVPVTPNRVSNNPYPDVGKPWHSIYGFNYTTSDIINNRIYLKDSNVDQSHIIVIDDQGETWELKDNIYLTTEVGRFFEFDVDNNDNAYIELVDYYTNFAITKFKIFYIKSSGEDGQVYANTLTKLTGPVWSRITISDTTNVSNVNSFIQFTHYASTLGYNPETPDEARKNSVLYQNTLDTLITLADFERATLKISGVANVRATDLTNDPGLKIYYNLGDINQDGSIDSEDLDILIDFLNGKRELTSLERKLADVNQDGEVNEDDLNCLKAYINPQVYDIGDINQDGSITKADLNLLKAYIENPADTGLTDFQIRLADINQDGKVDEKDSLALEQYLNQGFKPTSYFGSISDSSLNGHTGEQSVETTELLNGFVVKLYVAKDDEYENVDSEFDDLLKTQIQTELQSYKVLPLTIDIDFDSIQRYYWTITGSFMTTEPLSRDELQTIIIDINNTLRYNYALNKTNFNTVVSYRDVIETILSVDSRILTIDLDPIVYTDEEGNEVDKSEVTGKFQKIVPANNPYSDSASDEVTYTPDSLIYKFTLDRGPILPGSVMIRVNNGQYTLKDNSNGQIYNVDNILARKGTIDYVTGEVEIEFTSYDNTHTELTVDYTYNRAVLAPYKNLSTQTFYFDSSSLETSDVQDLI